MGLRWGRRVTVIDAGLLLDAHADVGECPTWWGARNLLAWVDPPRRVVHLTDPTTLDDRTVELESEVSALAPATDGRLVVAIEDGAGMLDVDTGAFTRLATVTLAQPGRFNDGACDPAGRFWAGTFSRKLTPGAGALYRFDAQGGVTRVLDGVTVSNGMRWSPDGGTFYYIDSMRNSVDAFTFDVDEGTLRDRRVLIPLRKGGGDGMTVDADGCLWVALWGHGEVRRFTPDGRHDRSVRVPAPNVTSCEFGGPALDTLYITSACTVGGPKQPKQPRPAGAVFVCTPGVTGLPARPFVV
jgi:sugar lactone lactonase YvrE